REALAEDGGAVRVLSAGLWRSPDPGEWLGSRSAEALPGRSVREGLPGRLRFEGHDRRTRTHRTAASGRMARRRGDGLARTMRRGSRAAIRFGRQWRDHAWRVA